MSSQATNLTSIRIALTELRVSHNTVYNSISKAVDLIMNYDNAATFVCPPNTDEVLSLLQIALSELGRTVD